MKKSSPIIWTIAGSDSGGGAGIQADLKVFNAFGVHGCSVITAITAQNTQGVIASEPVSPSMLEQQIYALLTDLPPAVIKTGMLGSTAACEILADFFTNKLNQLEKRPFIICDPVLKSTSGSTLLPPEAIDILINNLFPHIDVLTPNLPEAQALLQHQAGAVCNHEDHKGLEADSTQNGPSCSSSLRGEKSFPKENVASSRLCGQKTEDLAQQLLDLGVRSVLIKGGHAEENICRDYWTNGQESLWLSSPRIATRATHGTGCILASAIAANLALGQPIPEALASAKTYLNQSLCQPAHVGNGPGPMQLTPFENAPEHQPARNA